MYTVARREQNNVYYCVWRELQKIWAFSRRNIVTMSFSYYLLLVSFFWLVGVVAQLTLTSCKRESCRGRGRGKRWEVKYACRTEDGSFSLIRGFCHTPVLLRLYFVIENCINKVVSVCHTWVLKPLLQIYLSIVTI